MTVTGETAAGFRAVTAEEIAHLQQHGWVKLEKFIPLDRIADLLAIAKDKMGKTATGTRRLRRFPISIR